MRLITDELHYDETLAIPIDVTLAVALVLAIAEVMALAVALDMALRRLAVAVPNVAFCYAEHDYAEFFGMLAIARPLVISSGYSCSYCHYSSHNLSCGCT